MHDFAFLKKKYNAVNGHNNPAHAEKPMSFANARANLSSSGSSLTR
jgi:hypothetical protein